MELEINFVINGERRSVEVSAEDRLIDLIRDTLGLTGTKEGCGEGECGACTVILNGKTAASCLTYAYEADEGQIITIEGKNEMKELEVIQQAFVDSGAVQCGFCIPGMVLSTKVLLDEKVKPSREEIKLGLQGNLCRCTGYVKIVDGVELAGQRLREMRGEVL